MVTIQANLEVPSKYMERLTSGELWRDGGVLRQKSGEIVHILKDAPVLPEAKTAMNQTIAAIAKVGQNINASELIKKHKTVIIISGVVLFTFVASGACLYIKRKRKEKRMQAERHQKILELQSALICYIEDATDGKLTPEVIDRLILALDVLDDMGAQGQVQIEFTTQNLRDLVRCILNHTTNMAVAYDDESFADGDCTIINLKNHLNEQKEILKHTS